MKNVAQVTLKVILTVALILAVIIVNVHIGELKEAKQFNTQNTEYLGYLEHLESGSDDITNYYFSEIPSNMITISIRNNDGDYVNYKKIGLTNYEIQEDGYLAEMPTLYDAAVTVFTFIAHLFQDLFGIIYFIVKLCFLPVLSIVIVIIVVSLIWRRGKGDSPETDDEDAEAEDSNSDNIKSEEIEEK